MTILAVCAALFAVGVWMSASSDFDIEMAGVFGAFVGALGLFVCLISVPLNRMSVHGNVARLDALVATAAVAREVSDDIEGAAFRMTIAEANAWIASQKYWNGTMFDIWIPDVVETLEPIR